MIAKKENPNEIAIHPIKTELIKVQIEGLSPLISHKWSEKAKRQMLEKQQKKAAKGHDVRDPEKEYQESYYRNQKDEISFPATAFKQAIVGAARNVDGLQMTILRGALFVKGDIDGLIPIKYESERMREDMVRVGMGSADLRFRGELQGWSAELVIEYNSDVLSREQIFNLINLAGFSCGVGEWRPQKDGDFGRFKIKGT